ncbi:MAG TPA: nuclear transport factor 2 family protein [Acidimicrobiales bacterium]|nr:nuclear transport factor 2 family protein [Acidimicrobiales bacterium]
MSTGDRVPLVRSGYDRFNEQDLDRLLALFTDDIEWPDVMNGGVLHGISEVREYFERIFAITTLHVTVGDVVEIGDAVVAATYQQFYDLDGKALGEPRMVVNRFSFRGDLVGRMELTSQEDIPQEVRRRFRGF